MSCGDSATETPATTPTVATTGGQEGEDVTTPTETPEVIEETVETFEELSFDEFNAQLAEMTESMSAVQVMRAYYPLEVEGEEGNQTISTMDRQLENGNFQVTLIHDNQLDDSVRGEKYVMEMTKEGEKWTVVSLKKNWKCWSDRGHEDWSTELCH